MKNKSILERAREYEDNNIKNILKEEKQEFHLCAPIGWINDPNGFSSFKGEYHLLYQYHPYGTYWGPMHWGHSKSKDFIKWEQLPVAIAPDEKYDESGCFSGSAVEDNGKHILMYTGVSEKEDNSGNKIVRQTQCIAIGDGINYEKLDCNPVITHEQLPEGSSKEDFRDPKIWKEGEWFYSVIASRAADNGGQILMYKSRDLKVWEFVTVLDKSENKIGTMWECPDFFKLDEEHVLIISPMEVRANEKGYHNGHNSIFLKGNYDKKNCSFERTSEELIDGGLDFYAPQTLESKDGRRIMIGWMQNWENKIIPEEFKWCGMMTIPRELNIKDGVVVQKPVRELENYRKNMVKYKDIKVENEMSLAGIEGRTLDLIVEVDAKDSKEFIITLAKDAKNKTLLIYNPVNNILTFDRSYSGKLKNMVHKRDIKVKKEGTNIKLRILLDRYSVEVFVNDGEQAMTSTFYTSLSAKDITFESIGESIINIEKYDIAIL